jgi:hypothetical protein
VPRRRKYDAVRRIEVQLPPGKAYELEQAKGKLSWGDFVWELWEFWKLRHPETS